MSRVFDGPVNGVRLQQFPEEDLLPEIETWPSRDPVLVLDNAPFHHKPVCSRLAFLPPLHYVYAPAPLYNPLQAIAALFPRGRVQLQFLPP